ncbi:hypothetical protein HN747_03525 [archaeon]|nr:hypothetical protein [archaeon]
MGKELEQVEEANDLHLLIRGDRVKIHDIDYRGCSDGVHEVAVHHSRKSIEFIMPHPSNPSERIRRYRANKENITYDEDNNAFCIHEGRSVLENSPRETLQSADRLKFIGANQELAHSLYLAGF